MSARLTAVAAAMLASLALVAIPAVASANVELYEGSTKLATGTAIKAQANFPKFVNGSEAEIFNCTSTKFNGTVASNGPFSFAIDVSQAKFTGTGPEEKCQGAFNQNAVSLNAPLCWRHNVAMGESWNLYSNACSGSSEQPVLTIASTLFGTCTYRSEGVFGMNHTSLEPIKLQTPGYRWFTRISGSGSCWTKVGVSIFSLEVTNSTGGKLKEVHT